MVILVRLQRTNGCFVYPEASHLATFGPRLRRQEAFAIKYLQVGKVA